MKLLKFTKLQLALFLIALPLSASADVVIDNLKYVTNASTLTAEVATNDYDISTASILPTIVENGQTYTVTKIAENGFYRNHSLTSISIPNTIVEIGRNGIADCELLASVVIPNSVTSISNMAFWGNNFSSIVVEAGNPRYDSRNHSNCIIETATNTLIAGCKNTSIPGTVTTIGDRAFRSCRNLTSISIPNSVTHIGNAAFNGCGITSLALPNSLTTIDEWAFSSCSSLTSLVLPNSVTSIGPNAFMYCDALASVVLSNSVASVGSGAFAWCPNLKSFFIPKSVVIIEEGAFNYSNGSAHIYVNKKHPTALTANGAFGPFESSAGGMTLHVPEGSEEAYRNHEVFGHFGTIIGDLVMPEVGDVDGNGVVNVSDINALINIVLGK